MLPSPVEIVVNGQTRAVAEGTSVAVLLSALGVESRHVAVEINRDVVPRQRHPQHTLSAGDRVEVVTLVGGG